MGKTLRLRLGAIAVVLALAVGFGYGFFVDEASALPANEVERLYFSDATYSNQVGERLLLCDGHLYIWGIVTSYKLTVTTPCGW
jgi:hypothetical protein